MEAGWFEPGTIVLGTDSHTCTGGANDCLALGMGASDVVGAMITGKTWLRVPETVCIKTVGRPSPAARAKDVVLFALATLGQEQFLYRSIEWTGPWVEQLSGDARATVASMAVEMGAKCVFLDGGSSRTSLAGLQSCNVPPFDTVVLDIDRLPPYVARPHAPSNSSPITDCAGQTINYVFVGSCTNSRLEDMAEVAAVLRGRTVDPSVHCLVTPGSRQVYLDAIAAGYINDIVSAGAMVTPPGCGSCLGTQGSIPASGDRVMSTMNRNFIGRMGNRDAEIFLASPLVAAHTALMGRIPSLADLGSGDGEE
jgi:3-isopropylmalate/(R)-2-methylmalate dehydratase large subunit